MQSCTDALGDLNLFYFLFKLPFCFFFGLGKYEISVGKQDGIFIYKLRQNVFSGSGKVVRGLVLRSVATLCVHQYYLVSNSAEKDIIP